MNPELAKQLEAAGKTMNENGEMDRRAETSPGNGRKGGRPPIDYGALAEMYKAKNETVVRWYNGEFYEYDKARGVYVRYTERAAGARVGAFLKSGPVLQPGCAPISYTSNAERNVVGALRATYDMGLAPPAFISTRKSAAGWFAMSNGLLDVEAAARGAAGALHPHTPDFFSTYALPFEWNPEARAERFMGFLADVQPVEDGRAMLQMLAGLLLVPDTCYNVFFILQGEGGCGKSTYLKIVGAMLGADNVCSVPLSMFAEKHTTHRLTRTLANLVEDSPTADASRGFSLVGIEGVLKQVTDGGLLHVEPKGVDPWEAPATARCVFAQNGPLPQFADRSNGIWDRLRVVPFPVRMRDTEGQNPHLAQEIIAEELPGVFAWAVRGLGQLRQLKRFPQCEAGTAMIAEHRATCDREKTFLEERYKEMNGQFTPSGDMYAAYKAWCFAEGYQPKNSGNFKQEVQRVFPGATATNIRWLGKRTRGFWNLTALPEEAED